MNTDARWARLQVYREQREKVLYATEVQSFFCNKSRRLVAKWNAVETFRRRSDARGRRYSTGSLPELSDIKAIRRYEPSFPANTMRWPTYVDAVRLLTLPDLHAASRHAHHMRYEDIMQVASLLHDLFDARQSGFAVKLILAVLFGDHA